MQKIITFARFCNGSQAREGDESSELSKMEIWLQSPKEAYKILTGLNMLQMDPHTTHVTFLNRKCFQFILLSLVLVEFLEGIIVKMFFEFGYNY